MTEKWDYRLVWGKRYKKNSLSLKPLRLSCISRCYALLIWVTVLKCRVQNCNFLSVDVFICKIRYFTWHYQKANKWFSRTSAFPRKSYRVLFVCLGFIFKHWNTDYHVDMLSIWNSLILVGSSLYLPKIVTLKINKKKLLKKKPDKKLLKISSRTGKHEHLGICISLGTQDM